MSTPSQGIVSIRIRLEIRVIALSVASPAVRISADREVDDRDENDGSEQSGCHTWSRGWGMGNGQ